MSAPLQSLTLPLSVLDTDLYKLSMQAAILRLFPDAHATYRFTNRNPDCLFSRQSVERFRTIISLFSTIALADDEAEWLQTTCPYFTPSYIAFLAAYRFKPEQVKVKYTPVSDDQLRGHLDIDIAGPWVETILWEVPLMAALSEAYFQTVDTDWSYDAQDDLAYAKAKRLLDAGCHFSEFGTRRRRSFKAHDIVLDAFVRAARDNATAPGALSGTSNAYLARKYNLKVIGTIAHEWYMGVAALTGYENVNSRALKLWEEVYTAGTAPLISLTDTFTTTAFIKDMLADPDALFRWQGVRQDSGDPYSYAERIRDMYQSLGIPYAQKLLIFSDALDVDRCIKIKEHTDRLGFDKVSFGIGTFLTNDFKAASTGAKSKALNIVVKLASVNNVPCVKLSDDVGKNTGDKATVAHVKALYGFE